MDYIAAATKRSVTIFVKNFASFSKLGSSKKLTYGTQIWLFALHESE